VKVNVTQEDELIYFVNPEELKNDVTPTTSGAESSGNEEVDQTPLTLRVRIL